MTEDQEDYIVGSGPEGEDGAGDQEPRIIGIVPTLVALRDRVVMKTRIAYSNRLAAIDSGRDPMPPNQAAIIRKHFERFRALEDEINEDIKSAIEGIPEVEAVRRVKGVGPVLAAELFAMINIERCDTVSALWRYAGLAVIDGAAEKRHKGEVLHYNAALKVVCFKIGESFLRCKSPYRQIYDSAKEYYTLNRPDWPEKGKKMHVEMAARRKMVKIFMSHVWLVWRTMNGLPTRSPYAQGRLAHTHIFTPEEFGWAPA